MSVSEWNYQSSMQDREQNDAFRERRFQNRMAQLEFDGRAERNRLENRVYNFGTILKEDPLKGTEGFKEVPKACAAAYITSSLAVIGGVALSIITGGAGFAYAGAIVGVVAAKPIYDNCQCVDDD